MGAQQSKTETLSQPHHTLVPNMRIALDPRSPSLLFARTPIRLDRRDAEGNVISTPIRPNRTDEAENLISTPTRRNRAADAENPLRMLRKRLLRGFVYLNDPRSPSKEMNRTPLVINDSIDRTLDLDDTFADLFVEPRDEGVQIYDKRQNQTVDQTVHVDGNEANKLSVTGDNPDEVFSCDPNSSAESYVEEIVGEKETSMPSQARMLTAICGRMDPRSPTVGIDRTPIVFSDDDEANEENMLENALARLTLNMSNNSSVVSFDSPDSKELRAKPYTAKKTTNKHLDRVRRQNHKVTVPRKLSRQQCQAIYEDAENITTFTTPKSKKAATDKRTPLSCVKNRPNSMPRSVETASKSLGARQPLSNFDAISSFENAIR